MPTTPNKPDKRPLAAAVLDILSSMRLGFILLALITLYAVAGMTPIGLIIPPPLADPSIRASTIPQLPRFEMTPGMWFAAPLFRAFLAALIVNMTLSTITRVKRTWSALGTWATHLGVIVLAIGAAWHAAHKIEGHLTLEASTLATINPDGAPELRTIFADDSAATLTVWIEPPRDPHAAPAHTTETAIALTNLPRFNDWRTPWNDQTDPPSDQTQPRIIHEDPHLRITLTGFATDAQVLQLRQPDGAHEWLPIPADTLEQNPEWKGRYRTSAIALRIESFTPSQTASPSNSTSNPPSNPAPEPATLETWVPFATGIDAAASRFLSDGRRIIILYAPAARAIDSHALRLSDFRVETFQDTDVARDFAVSVEVRTSEARNAEEPSAPAVESRRTAIILLNDPLILRDPNAGWLDRILATQRWTLSLQGWDEQGWTRNNRARFVVLKVANAAGMPIIALAAWMIAFGVLWSIALRPLARAIARHLASRNRAPGAPHAATPTTTTTRAPITRPLIAAIPIALILTAAALTLTTLRAPDPAASLSPPSASRLADTRHQLVDDNGTLITVETWLARCGAFVADLPRAPGAALAANLWLEPATLINQPVIAIPKGPLLDTLLHAAALETANTTNTPEPNTQQYRAGQRVPVETVMRHIAEAMRSDHADPRLLNDANLVLDRVETALALIHGPPLPTDSNTQPPTATLAAPLRTTLERADDQNLLLWLVTAIGAVWILAAATRARAKPLTHAPVLRITAAATITAIATAALIIRGLIAARIPMHNLHEALMLMTALASLAALIITCRSARRGTPTNRTIGTACTAATTILAIIAAGVPTPGALIEREAGILASADLLAWHVGIIIAGYAAIVINAALAITWIASRREALIPPMRRMTDLSFALLTIGIALGAWWAHSAWGRWWAFDPKETFSLILWLIVLAAVHIRAAEPRRIARWLAIAAIIALLAMIWNFIGVNLLLPGLHSYAA